ncbi:GumC family protein [Roseomonas sp. BN140053]|uniref:GumC family protein n=1 Tax=Roseomonas sp. BN140053 TaxID=3391898 RepID=UPI0039E846F3
MDLAQLDRSLEAVAKSVWLVAWRHKLILVATSLLVFVPVFLFMLSLQPRYEAATLLITGQGDLERRPGEARRTNETPASLTRIALSEEVVVSAIGKVGLQNLVGPVQPASSSIFARLRQAVFPSLVEPQREVTPIEAALPRISAGLNARGEPNSDIVTISFRHPDPVIAAQFSDAVAQAFIERQTSLYSRPGAVDFFQRQRQRFEEELQRASDQLEKFSTQTGVYSATEQRQLLLRRMNDLSSALAVTRGSISQKVGERQALADSLRRLAPVTRSPYVSSLVDSLGGDRPSPSRGADARALDDRSSDPPLLLVRVYQDSMVALFRVNSELTGAQSLQQQQQVELGRLTAELNTLTENERQFANLTRAVDQASYNSDTYYKRMIEEQINAESNTVRFSSVKVLQRALVPLRPIFPNYIVVTVAALLGSLLAGLAAALLRSWTVRR